MLVLTNKQGAAVCNRRGVRQHALNPRGVVFDDLIFVMHKSRVRTEGHKKKRQRRASFPVVGRLVLRVASSPSAGVNAPSYNKTPAMNPRLRRLGRR